MRKISCTGSLLIADDDSGILLMGSPAFFYVDFFIKVIYAISMNMVQGVFDGNAVRPLESIDWKKNQRVSIFADKKSNIQALKKFCGKVNLDIDLDVLRERK